MSVTRFFHITAEFLNDKFSEKHSPAYHVREIAESNLQLEREKRLYVQYSTVAGSDSFRMIIFRPGQEFFFTSCQLCICDDCLNLEFEKCPKFKQYIPSVSKLSKKHLRSATTTPIEIADKSVDIAPNTVFAVSADSDVSNFFLVMCDKGEKVHEDPTTPLEDSMGHKIFDGVRYVTGRYLECYTFNNRSHVCKVSKKKVFVLSESILLPYVPVLETTKSNIKISNEIIIELQVRSSL